MFEDFNKEKNGFKNRRRSEAEVSGSHLKKKKKKEKRPSAAVKRNKGLFMNDV